MSLSIFIRKHVVIVIRIIFVSKLTLRNQLNPLKHLNVKKKVKEANHAPRGTITAVRTAVKGVQGCLGALQGL